MHIPTEINQSVQESKYHPTEIEIVDVDSMEEDTTTQEPTRVEEYKDTRMKHLEDNIQ